MPCIVNFHVRNKKLPQVRTAIHMQETLENLLHTNRRERVSALFIIIKCTDDDNVDIFITPLSGDARPAATSTYMLQVLWVKDPVRISSR